jgi:hypothetical protein
MLRETAGGVGSVALAYILNEQGLLSASAADAPMHIPKADRKYDLLPRQPHFEPTAKAMISLFMHGGPSHMDLFDPKPELSKHDGKDYQGDVTFSFVNRATKTLLGSPFKFTPHGQSGTPLSELLPYTAKIVDEIAVVRSMYTGINGHEPSIWSMNTGIARPGRPALGSWLTYGLGTENQDLPAYCVLTDPGGLPVDGVRNWSQGWLPATYQGTAIRPKTPRILNLDVPAELAGPIQRHSLSLLNKINERHLAEHPGESELEARIASYELAANMQTAAKEALDISKEPDHIKKMYGIDNPATQSYAERCLIARRLVERGVRFVQLFINGQIWDNHESIFTNLKSCCAKTDQPSAALVMDLKQRGLLDSTVVTWGGEFGRLPVTESHGKAETRGRDHNGQGFSTWLAGGGIQGGQTYGATDDFGHRVAVDRVGPSDYHATLLHLFGMRHKELTYFHNGKQERLTDTPECRVVKELLKRPPNEAVTQA